MRRKLLVVSAVATALGACAGGGAGPLGIGAIIGDRNLAAAEPLFSEDEERCLDTADQLLEILTPRTEAQEATGSFGGSAKRAARCKRIKDSVRSYFTSTGATSPASYTDQQRNEVLDALIAASNRKCGRYTAMLKNADGAMNGGLSLASIVTGGLGAIVGGKETARALSGTASIFSGSRAALNEVYLTNQTIHVLAAAYDKARREQRQEITNRQACPTRQYTMMRAMEDAFTYHASCSIVVGLAETARSIERAENPGLDTMRKTFTQMAALQAQAAEFGNGRAPTPVLVSRGPVSLQSVNGAGALVDKLAIEREGARKEADRLKVERDEAKAAEKATGTELAGAQAALAAKEKAWTAQEDKWRLAATAVTDAEAAFAREAQRLASNIPSSSRLDAPRETRACPYG